MVILTFGRLHDVFYNYFRGIISKKYFPLSGKTFVDRGGEVEEEGSDRKLEETKKWKFYEDSNLPVVFTPISLGPRLVFNKHLLVCSYFKGCLSKFQKSTFHISYF